MLKDIAVIGSSHASGVGSGGIDRNGIGELKSWVNFVADMVHSGAFMPIFWHRMVGDLVESL